MLFETASDRSSLIGAKKKNTDEEQEILALAGKRIQKEGPRLIRIRVNPNALF